MSVGALSVGTVAGLIAAGVFVGTLPELPSFFAILTFNSATFDTHHISLDSRGLPR